MSKQVRPDFSMDGAASLLSPEDCGLVNGHITLNGWIDDVAAVRGVYAPPFFSDNFRLEVRFNGRRIAATATRWAPEALSRSGRLPGWRIKTELLPVAEKRAAILCIDVENTAAASAELAIQLEVTGGVSRSLQWGFSKPGGAGVAEKRWKGNVFTLFSAEAALSVGCTLALHPHGPLASGVLDAAAPLTVPPKGHRGFYVGLALDDDSEFLVNKILANPEQTCGLSRDAWSRRVERLFEAMPEFHCDDKAWERLYNRSLLHLLLNEWDVPEFTLHPYYSTGSVNGGCIGCYLWNYGGPYRLWSLLNPASAKAHIRTFLQLDLSSCYAFDPIDGKAFGPYYPVNQEKILLLIHAYVLQTKDHGFLHETVGGKAVIEHVVEQALMHDDLAKPAVLVDYGNGNHHLELRRTFRYDGILPDLNLRRCINFHLADELCRLAGWTPPVDLVQRAESLKQLVKAELFDREAGWFRVIDGDGDGKVQLRYTLQMFKALGWNRWAIDDETEDALLQHLVNPDEFLGAFGLHSLSKKDPAYDEFDVDNGGPGACPSFTPAVIDRLYMCGRTQEAEALLTRLLWLADSLPYWGDSQRADIRDYRRDTPLQCDIEGAAIAQTMIFGLFGLTARADGTVEISPHLPKSLKRMELRNVHLAGRRFSVICTADGGTVVKCGRRRLAADAGGSIVLSDTHGSP